jgi:hypothetical protein
MNPVAIFFIVFFLSFQGIYLYLFTQSIPGIPLVLVALIAVIFAAISAFAEIDWDELSEAQAALAIDDGWLLQCPESIRKKTALSLALMYIFKVRL